MVYVIRVGAGACGVNRSHGGVGGKQVSGPSGLGRMRPRFSIRARHPRADGLRECARAGEVLAVPVGACAPG